MITARRHACRPRYPARGLGTLLGAFAAAFALLATPAVAAPSAQGDFNGDGSADLAVGAPTDSVSGQQEAGSVNVIYGSGRGLRAAGDQQFTKEPQEIAGAPQPDAFFGAALAAGDLDDDGFADLAIGAPGEDVGALTPAPDSGAVTVLYGSSGGLRARPAVGSWSQNSVGVSGDAQAGDDFGWALAIGDFDGDGVDDVAIAAPGDSVGGQQDAGAVNVLYGTSEGLSATGEQLWTQDTRGIKGTSGADHRFGFALAGGDVSDNGRDELAIGIRGGVIGGDSAGAVSALYGRSGGLSAVDDLWSQDAAGVKGVAEPADDFGWALAIGDFDADGTGDMAIGAPGDSVGGDMNAGAVNVLYGSATGLGEQRDQLWTQDSPGIKSRASFGERLGSALAARDFSGNGADELAIGAPGHRVGSAQGAGAVNVLYGNPRRGLSDRADQFWSQDSPGIKGRAEPTDTLGDALGSGDFDGDGVFDLAIGVPNDSVAGFPHAGAVNTIYGSATGLREDPDQLWTQATKGIEGAVGNDRFGSALASGLPSGD